MNVLVVRAALPIHPAFVPLTPTRLAIVTTLGMLGAALVLTAISRHATRPARTFRIVARIVLVLSFVPDLVLLSNSVGMFPGANALWVWTLSLTRVVAAVFAVFLLPRLANGRSRRPRPHPS